MSISPREFDIGRWEDEADDPGLVSGAASALGGPVYQRDKCSLDPIKVFPRPPEASFKSVPKEVWDGVWKRALSKPWDRAEAQVILEGRAL
eukprot:3990781-Pyramimonas_sp.AAC.1